MSRKMTPEEEAKQRAKIIEWQKEGASKEKLRKQRNHLLIHAGLASIDMIRKDKLDLETLLQHVPIEKQDFVKETIKAELKSPNSNNEKT